MTGHCLHGLPGCDERLAEGLERAGDTLVPTDSLVDGQGPLGEVERPIGVAAARAIRPSWWTIDPTARWSPAASATERASSRRPEARASSC